MNQQTSRWPTGLQRSLQSPDSPAGFQGITEILTDNLSAEEIQKDHQVAPLSSHLEIGQVTDPNLVWSLRSKAAIQLVANDPLSWVTLGGSRFFGHSQPTAQALRLHLSGNPSTAELGKLGLLPQLSRNQRTPCAAIETCIEPGNRPLQGLFLLRALRRLPLAPLVVTTERASQEVSHSANLKALTVSLDEEIATQGV